MPIRSMRARNASAWTSPEGLGAYMRLFGAIRVKLKLLTRCQPNLRLGLSYTSAAARAWLNWDSARTVRCVSGCQGWSSTRWWLPNSTSS